MADNCVITYGSAMGFPQIGIYMTFCCISDTTQHCSLELAQLHSLQPVGTASDQFIATGYNTAAAGNDSMTFVDTLEAPGMAWYNRATTPSSVHYWTHDNNLMSPSARPPDITAAPIPACVSSASYDGTMICYYNIFILNVMFLLCKTC